MDEPRRNGDGIPGARPRMKPRRRGVVLVTLLVLLAVIGALMRWASRPQQVGSLVLSQASRASGLRITARGVTEYQLRGVPRLVLRDVVAQRDGDAVPVLRARRIALALPWSTLRSRGRNLDIHHVALDSPQLDIGALQRWLATRPDTGPTRVPGLSHGLAARDARIVGDGWSVEGLDVDVPMLAPGHPVRAHLRGRAIAATTTLPFDLHATLARPAAHAGLGVAGHLDVVRSDWQLALDLQLQGRPDLANGLVLERMRLGANARYVAGETRIPFAIGLAGRAAYHAGLSLRPVSLALREGDAIPDTDARGAVSWGRLLAFQLDGQVARWPRGWPALPPPINRPPGPLPFVLRYQGTPDLSGEATLQLHDGRTHFDGRFRLPRILSWLQGPADGNPLPPLDGRLSTPRIDIPGATLEGVEITVSDGDGR